jgi:hypothetical protein
MFLFEDFRLDRRGGLFCCNGTGAFDPSRSVRARSGYQRSPHGHKR